MTLWPRMQISPRSPSGERLVLLVEDRHLDAPDRVADRAGLARAAEHVEARDRRRLGEAVALEDLDAELLVERVHHLDRHRRAARDAAAQRSRGRTRGPAWCSSAKYIVGTPAKSVTRSRCMIVEARSSGVEARQQREACRPPRSSRSGCRSARSEWKSGSVASATSLGRAATSSCGTHDRALKNRFECVSSAPFGLPGRARGVEDHRGVVGRGRMERARAAPRPRARGRSSARVAVGSRRPARPPRPRPSRRAPRRAGAR